MQLLFYKISKLTSCLLLCKLLFAHQANCQETDTSVTDTNNVILQHRTFHAGLIYPLSSNGTKANQISSRMSFQAIFGINNGVTCVDFSGIGSLNVGNQKGVMASGVINIVQGKAKGAIISGVVNVNNQSLKGVQIAGAINIGNSLNGAQISGLVNHASTSNIQISGAINNTTNTNAQVAGLLNFANKAAVQISGFANVANENSTQISGFMNVAKQNKGVQLAGFLNIGEDVAYPIGIINIIKNGRKNIGVSIDEIGNTTLSFRSGGTKSYGILGVGQNFFLKEAPNVLEVGWGLFDQISNRWSLQYEIANVANTDFKKNAYYKSSFRILLGLHAKNLYIFVGPTLNYINNMKGLAPYGNIEIFKLNGANSNNTFTVGALGGIAVNL